jgi:hypothetical protein
MPYNIGMIRSRKVAGTTNYRTAERSGNSKSKSWKIRLVVAVCLLAAMVFIIRIVSAPVTGHTTKIDVSLAKKQPTSSPRIDTQPSAVTNTYYTLNLPVGYHVQTGASTPVGVLSNQVITKPGALGSLIINIAVKALPDGGLENDSSYRLRLLQTDRFSTTSQTYRGETVHVSNDSQSAAVAAFWPHHGYLATIGISSSLDNPAADDNAEELSALKVLLDAWRWQ